MALTISKLRNCIFDLNLGTMIDSNKILLYLASNKNRMEKEYHLVKIGLFGSIARGEQNEQSDIDLIVEFADWKKEKTEVGGISNGYIICLDNTAYYIQNYLVERITTFEAIGAGMDFALTAMALGHSAKEAVQVAIDLSVYCEAPIIEFKRKN